MDSSSEISDSGSGAPELSPYTVALPPLTYTSTDEEEGLISIGSETEKYNPVYADEFIDLRRLCNIEESGFAKSLNAREKWNAKGGKSDATFYKTQDGRFVIKEISRTEYRSFVDKIGPKYFEHMKTSLHNSNEGTTCLVKIFAVYEVRSESQTRFLIVMENFGLGMHLDVLYDLKGKLNRNIDQDLTDPKHTRIEEDFVQDMTTNSQYISDASKQTLALAVSRDTMFLQQVNVMDYSLLVGVDNENREMLCGIIDYLGPYSTVKKLEWLAKTAKMICMCTNEEPTVTNPLDYKKRFTTFIDREFKCSP